MDICDVYKLSEYQALEKMSGISFDTDAKRFAFDDLVLDFINNRSRFPYLDEIPYADSTKAFISKHKIQSVHGLNSVGFDELFKLPEYQNLRTLEDVQRKMNYMYSDLEISLTKLGEKVLVNIKRRPSQFRNTTIEEYSYDRKNRVDRSNSPEVNRALISARLKQMSELYGIKVNLVTSEELSDSPILEQVSDAQTAKAFIHNGEIYINTDLATTDSPIHELMHMFLGTVKYTDPRLYYNILESLSSFENFDIKLNELKRTYKNRTDSDLREELFVDEFSRYLIGDQETLFKKATDKQIFDLFRQINRNIDSLLDGEFSIKSINPEEAYSKSINELTEALDSKLLDNATTVMDLARQHRILANHKEQLTKDNNLIQICD